jgi:hypothetical protein
MEIKLVKPADAHGDALHCAFPEHTSANSHRPPRSLGVPRPHQSALRNGSVYLALLTLDPKLPHVHAH